MSEQSSQDHYRETTRKAWSHCRRLAQSNSARDIALADFLRLVLHMNDDPHQGGGYWGEIEDAVREADKRENETNNQGDSDE